MKTNFTIKNFRVFDDNGVDIELAPITILTGKNSAGKSSVVKAISILNSFLEQIRRDKENGKAIMLHKYKIQFNELFEGTLGNFTDILHRGSANHCITLEYDIHSTMLFEDVKVSFSFKDADEGKDDNHLHYGVVSNFCVKTLQDEIIYLSNEEGELICNLNIFKNRFADFAMGEFLANTYLGAFSVEGESREQRRDREKEAKENLDEWFDEKTRKNIFRYLRDPMSRKEPIVTNGNFIGIIASLNEGKQIIEIPVIEECLVEYNNEEIPEKVEEILKDNITLDDAEKFVVREFISNIVASRKRIDEFWKDQENLYLESAGNIKNRTEDQKVISKIEKLGGKAVCLPNTFTFAIGDDLWKNYPGIWIIEDEEKEKKEQEIEQWKNRPVDTFPKMYEVLMRLNAAYVEWKRKSQSDYSPSNLYTYEEGIEHPAGQYSHYAYQMLCEYASRTIESVLFPIWTENFKYIPSSRALPKRIYTPETGAEFYSTLQKYLIAKTEYEDYQNSFRGSNKKEYVANTFLNKWIGKEGFDIGESISVNSVMGSAIVVKLKKNDGTEVFLTDEGFGLTQLISILIKIETTILQARGVKYNDYVDQSSLDNLNTLKFYYEQQTIAVEEPEIHLHPAFQSKLADMFISAMEYNIHFIVETHSEYMIRKLQKLVAQKNLETKGILMSSKGVDRNTISIYYLYDANPDKRDGNPQVQKIGLKENGLPTKPFGPGFFDVADDLSMDLFTLKMQDK